MDKFLQLTLTGLTNGAIFSLVALGFVLIYKASDVINFAQGDFLLVGAYITYGIIVQVGLPWSISLLLAIVIAVILGVVVMITGTGARDEFYDQDGTDTYWEDWSEEEVEVEPYP